MNDTPHGESSPPAMDLDAIRATIPHRDPFLWLDEVVEIDDQQIVARKWIDPKLDVFEGHYPSFPVLPGVLTCEAAFQAGAVLIARVASIDDDLKPVVTRLNNVKFRRAVRPDDTLDITVKLTDYLKMPFQGREADAFYLSGRVRVDGQLAVQLDFACTAAAIE